LADVRSTSLPRNHPSSHYALAKLRDSKHISWHWKGLCRDPDDEADVAIRSFRAPGTTHACKNLFPEEVYVSVGFKADLSTFHLLRRAQV
jgi:hypothetical protein